MSIVTGIVLCTSLAEEVGDDEILGPAWKAVQAWLTDRYFEQLRMVDDYFAGTKHPQIMVGGGGYNHLPHEEFAAFVCGLKWEEPGSVVLVVQREEGDVQTFRPRPL